MSAAVAHDRGVRLVRHLRSSTALAWPFLLFSMVAVCLQYLGGAYRAEFGSNPDEPAHYVTGLLVRDYIAQGMPTSPMQYARQYYAHYPKVALGHWPPVFYVAQAIWTLVVPPGRASLLLLMAVFSALLAAVLFHALRGEVPVWMAMAASLLLLSLPMMQQLGREIMAETLTAVLCLLAVISLGRYLDSEHWQDAAWFGAWSALAILTKGTGFALAALPALGVVLTGRWHLLRKWSFWLPALIVIAACGPWYAWAVDARHESVALYGGPHFFWPTLVRNPYQWLQILGVPLTLLAVVGMVLCVARIIRRTLVSGLWIGLLGWIIAVVIIRAEISVARPMRSLSLVTPALTAMAAFGLSRIVGAPIPGNLSRRLVVVLAVVGAAALFVGNIASMPAKEVLGYQNLAATLLASPDLRGAKFLICSDSVGEGVFVSEVAMRERRPGHEVARATKLLSRQTWMGYGYRLRYETPEEVVRAIEREKIQIVVLDVRPDSTLMPHERLLAKAIREQPCRWTPALPGDYRRAAGRSARTLQVYRLTSAAH